MAINQDNHSNQPTAPREESGLTGRYLVLCRENDRSVTDSLRARTGLRLASASDFGSSVVPAALGGADGVYFDRLGVAVTTAPPDQLTPLVGMSDAGGVMAVEPERVLYILGVTPRPDHPPRTLPSRAIQASVLDSDANDLACMLSPAVIARVRAVLDETARTWGLVSTRVIDSRLTGRGVRVAVLDTGLNASHPDFAGRTIVSASFVEGEAAEDGQSHGTHCIGTALGPQQPNPLPRYGIACEADIYVGKVLNNRGRGNDGSILAGINWAMANGCRVVSMSLGAATQPGQPFSQVYETVAQRALAANTLLIAAAGNESERPNIVKPVGHPANCPSVMAVGAIDADMQIASFSTRRFDANGGGVDIVAPGVNVYSTVPMPGRYKRMNGTSMATPHVAGIAALYAEAHPAASARDLWELIVRGSRRLDLPEEDAGAGLVQAPA